MIDSLFLFRVFLIQTGTDLNFHIEGAGDASSCFPGPEGYRGAAVP